MFKKISTLLLGCSLSFFLTPSGQCSSLQDLSLEMTQGILKHLTIKEGVTFMETNKALHDTFKDDANLWRSYFQRIRGHSSYEFTSEKKLETAQDYINALKDMKKPKLLFPCVREISGLFISQDGKKLSGYVREENKLNSFIIDNKPDAKPKFLPVLKEMPFSSPTKMSIDGKSILGRFKDYSFLWESNEQEEYGIRLFSRPDPTNPNSFIITDMDSTGKFFVGYYKATEEEPCNKAFWTNFKDKFEYLDPSKSMTADLISEGGSTVVGTIKVTEEDEQVQKVYTWSHSTGINILSVSPDNKQHTPVPYSVNKTGNIILTKSENTKWEMYPVTTKSMIHFKDPYFSLDFQVYANPTGERFFYKVWDGKVKNRPSIYLVKKNKEKNLLNPVLHLPYFEDVTIFSVNDGGTWISGHLTKNINNPEDEVARGFTAYIPAYEDFEKEGITFKAEDVPPSIQDGDNTNP